MESITNRVAKKLIRSGRSIEEVLDLLVINKELLQELYEDNNPCIPNICSYVSEHTRNGIEEENLYRQAELDGYILDKVIEGISIKEILHHRYELTKKTLKYV